jgi:16S rRNA (uracil1498-N3)-methyltransferase
MMELRRFRVGSLEGVPAGAGVALPASEIQHIHVLRLTIGDELELLDAVGRTAPAELRVGAHGHLEAALLTAPQAPPARNRRSLVLAVAWPKGKRAALLVEKCTEIGVDRIMPVRFARSVVHKKDDSSGVVRQRRIVIESAKQCGRRELPEIVAEQSFGELLAASGGHGAWVLDPHGDENFLSALLAERGDSRRLPVLLVVGPEGGLSADEVDDAVSAGMRRVRMAENVLRVETAALMACAIAQAVMGLREGDDGQE